jgi:hypothetical protein
MWKQWREAQIHAFPIHLDDQNQRSAEKLLLVQHALVQQIQGIAARKFYLENRLNPLILFRCESEEDTLSQLFDQLLQRGLHITCTTFRVPIFDSAWQLPLLTSTL